MCDTARNGFFISRSLSSIFLPLYTYAVSVRPSARPSVRPSRQADLLLVLGTSLNVQPVSRILQFIPPHVPQVQIVFSEIDVHRFLFFF